MIYVKFDEIGIVVMWSEAKRPHHIAIEDIPKGFKGNEHFYSLDIEEGDLVGIKLRDDLVAFKAKLEAQRLKELEQEKNLNLYYD